MKRFSLEYGFDQRAQRVLLRFEAPAELRAAVVDIARESGGGVLRLGPTVCRALRHRADGNHYSHEDIIALLDAREWFEVYDVIEALAEALSEADVRYRSDTARTFHEKINDYFERSSIGWRLRSGRLEVRGEAEFESALRSCETALRASSLGTARGEIQEARHDLSRRPQPDATGAVQHSMAGLECVLREITGNPKDTLGALIANNRHLFPPPLDQALEKLWGFASERGRHLRESRTPTATEAEFLVHVAAALIAFLLDQRSGGSTKQDDP